MIVMKKGFALKEYASVHKVMANFVKNHVVLVICTITKIINVFQPLVHQELLNMNLAILVFHVIHPVLLVKVNMQMIVYLVTQEK